MQYLIPVLLLLSACAAKPAENPAFYATKAAKPKVVKSLITPGFK